MGKFRNLLLVGFAFYQTWIYTAFFTEAPYLNAIAPDAARYQVYGESLVFLCGALLAIALLPLFGKKLSSQAFSCAGALLMALAVPAMAVTGSGFPAGEAGLHVAAAASGLGTAFLGAAWVMCFRKASSFGVVTFPLIMLAEALLILLVQLHSVVATASLVLFPLVSAACSFELIRRDPLPMEETSPFSFRGRRSSLQRFVSFGAPWLVFGLSLGLLIGSSGNGSFTRLTDITWLIVVALTALTVIAVTVILSPVKILGFSLFARGDSDSLTPEAAAQRPFGALVCFCAIMALCLFIPLFFGNIMVGQGSIQMRAASSIVSFSVVELATTMLLATAAEVFKMPVTIVYGMGRAGRVLGVILGSWLSTAVIADSGSLPLSQLEPIVMVLSCESFLVLALYFVVRKTQLGRYGTEGSSNLEETCRRLAAQHKLSPREQEVFLLLAKGRSQGRIQEELCIARSTATTHIHHVYQKLDVHSRQGLIDLVEKAEQSPDASLQG